MFKNLSYQKKTLLFMGVICGFVLIVSGLTFWLIPDNLMVPVVGIHVQVLIGTMLPLVCAIAGMIAEKKVGRSQPRPIIHYWIRNGVTAVCADAEYQAAVREWERLNKANWALPCPQPRMLAFFTDNPKAQTSLGDYLTGPDVEYVRLATQCSVRKSEMFIPKSPKFDGFRGHSIPVDYPALYYLIFGEDEHERAFENAHQQ